MKANTYAKVLVEVMMNTPAQQEKLLPAFVRLLQKNGQTHKIREIISLAECMYAKKTGQRNITIESARKVNAKNILQKLKRQGDKLQEKIRPELVAGVIITVNNEAQLDFSLKSRLDSIFKWAMKF